MSFEYLINQLDMIIGGYMKDFKQRYGDWALVTGGTSGIGAALVRQFAAAGMNIVLVARTQTKLDEMAKSLKSEFGVEVRTIAADLSAPQSPAMVIDAVKDLEIAVLVPGAAVETSGYFVDTTIERQAALVQMDVTTPMMLTHHFGAGMASRGRGAILLVSSLSGWSAQPYMANYGASKAYILSLGASLYHEMKDKGVDVSVLSPGPTDTPMIANSGVDFDSMGMSIMTPESVALEALEGLGKRPDTVPGFKNRMMVFMMTRAASRRSSGAMFKKMMGKALGMSLQPA
jgi:short-subunit dehydrogenase